MLLFSLNDAVFAVPLKMWLHSIKINTKPLNKLQAFARYPHLNCWVCVKYQTKPKAGHQTVCDQVPRAPPPRPRPHQTKQNQSWPPHMMFCIYFTESELSVKTLLRFLWINHRKCFFQKSFCRCVFHLKVSVPSIISLLDYKFSH